MRHEMRRPNLHGTLFYFSVPDCGERQRWAEAKKQIRLRAKTDIGEHGFIAIIGDSEDNSIGLNSMV